MGSPVTITPPSLNYVANDVQGWVAALGVQGIDLSGNGHLKVVSEAKEYAEDQSIEEAADVFISLLASLVSNGYDCTDLAVAAHAKMMVNRQRTWAQGEDGTYQHVG